jgi:ABC-type antimicrobial peptide transport system permease subunit
MPHWNASRDGTLIELAPGVNVVAFKDKLFEHVIKQKNYVLKEIRMTPLTTMRYEDPTINRKVKFEHILLFAFAGTLVILCSLFNYLTLFVCRFKMREKEFALRIVAGASGRSLLLLWAVEFLISLIPAFLLSLILIQITISPLRKLSGILMDLSSVYLESAIYIGAIIAVSLLVFIGVLFLFRRKSLNVSIRKSNKNLFRKTSIVFQLAISIGFIFCTSVMIKQLYFLHHTDLGFTYKNTASLFIYTKSYSDIMENQLKQIPEITETLTGYTPLLPVMGQTTYSVMDWDDKSPDMEGFYIEHMDIPKQYAEFYGFQLIEGEMLSEDEPENNVLINESAVKAFGWEHPIGKTFTKSKYKVKGVIRNVYKSLPTVPVKPILYKNGRDYIPSCVLFKYQKGKWETCKNKIEKSMKKGFDDYQFKLADMEEEYDKYLVSENALLKLLSLLSLVCVIISVFGVFSLISLSCEERRKEIAIRKINGATMKDILEMYFKTYFSLLIIGAVIAFPIGYYIMKQWIEQYVKQTGIGAWIYLSIIFIMTFVIVLCVGWRVYKASVENPANCLNQDL